MKTLLPAALFLAATGLTQANIVESININLSPLNAGSTLSGTFTLPDAPVVGDTTTALLTFSDPADYNPTALTATITVGSGVPGDTVDFSNVAFTNLNNANSMTRNVNLTVQGGAECTSFPCTATGRFEDGSPAVFSSSYTIAPASVGVVPEPGYAGLLAILLAGLFIGRKYRQAS